MGCNEVERKIQEVKDQFPGREVRVLLKLGRPCEKSTISYRYNFKKLVENEDHIQLHFEKVYGH